MNPEALDFWRRAVRALETARALTLTDPDACASRAYYAAFYAVSALFAREGRTFTKHSAVEGAVHLDLVKAGRWPVDLGKNYSYLAELRITGDYGGGLHVSEVDAAKAVACSENILKAISAAYPNSFAGLNKLPSTG